MTGSQIIQKVTALNLAPTDYVVFGSCPLAIAGIRESSDIDMLVRTEVLDDLKSRGWQLIRKSEHSNPYVYEDFEAYDMWDFGGYSASLEELLATATVVGDVPFASIDEVRKWKVAMGRPKDRADIALIDAFIAEHPAGNW